MHVFVLHFSSISGYFQYLILGWPTMLLNLSIVILLLMWQFRKLRDRVASKIHIQLSVALFCMLLVFVSGIDRTDDKGGCVAVSALVHYFTLAAVMWMGAESVVLFQLLVVVFVHITAKHIIIISLICWCKSNRSETACAYCYYMHFTAVTSSLAKMP